MDFTLEELRAFMISAPTSMATRGVALALGVGVLVLVLALVRSRRLKEEYTPVWVALALIVSIIGIHLEFLRGIANLIGAWTLSSTVFFLGEVALGAICLHHAVRLSSSGQQIKVLLQDVALLRARVEELSGEGGDGRSKSW